MTNQTIGQAAKEREIKPDTFKKRIDRALKDTEIRQKLGIKADIKTGLRDPFTSELEALLSASGWGDAPGNRQEKTPEPDEKPEPKPDKPTRTRRKKPVIVPAEIPTPEPEPDPKPDTPTITARFFQSEIIVLFSLGILILSDGFSMSLLAGRTFDDNLIAFALFTVVGLIIGYSAISTTRTAHAAPKKNWEKGYFGFWIILFAIFQTALHGSAFEMFGNWSEMIGRSLIVISIPLATASLTTTILKR